MKIEDLNILENNKLIAEFLGWKYIPHNNLQSFPKAGWWRPAKRYETNNYVNEKYWGFECRKHADLRFINNVNLLLDLIQLIERSEFGSSKYNDKLIRFNFNLQNNGGFVFAEIHHGYIVYDVDHAHKDLTWTQNIWLLVVDTIKYIKTCTE